jgi:hypothetical protein
LAELLVSSVNAITERLPFAPEESIYNEFENKIAQILMKTTPEQTREIIRWGHQHRRMLREKYRRQFVAYSSTRLLAAGRDWDVVEALADAEGEPYLVKVTS